MTSMPLRLLRCLPPYPTPTHPSSREKSAVIYLGEGRAIIDGAEKTLKERARNATFQDIERKAAEIETLL